MRRYNSGGGEDGRKKWNLLVECVEEQSDVVGELGADAFRERSVEAGVRCRRVEPLRVCEA